MCLFTQATPYPDRMIPSLENLARHNDTLLDLSGLHYNLTQVLTQRHLMAPKPVEEKHRNAFMTLDPDEVESIVYATAGAAIIFLLTASAFFAACQCITRQQRLRRSSEENDKNNFRMRNDDSRGNLLQSASESFDEDFRPKMIYSQSFSDGLASTSIDPRHEPKSRYTPGAPMAQFTDEDEIDHYSHADTLLLSPRAGSTVAESDILDQRTRRESLENADPDRIYPFRQRPFSVQSNYIPQRNHHHHHHQHPRRVRNPHHHHHHHHSHSSVKSRRILTNGSRFPKHRSSASIDRS